VFDDNLTGMTGMDAPALDGGNAPVVRYQDLLRGSSPASAGAPALTTQRPYAPEVVEAAEEISEIGYGPSPLDIPSYVAPYYGSAQAGYGVTLSEIRSNTSGAFPVLKKGDSDKGSASGGNKKYTGQVADLQKRLNNWFGTSLPITGYFGDQTAKAVTDYLADSIVGAGQDATLSKSGMVGANEWAYLYDVLPDTTVKTARTGAEDTDKATKGVKGTTGTDARSGAKRSGAAAGASSFLDQFNITMGYKEDPKNKFQVSDRSADQIGEGTDWGKVALWGGVAVAGIVATVLIVRAVSNKE
jgi:peptidoglycan hydrolase-like protein with peptidoglycan-binding domain